MTTPTPHQPGSDDQIQAASLPVTINGPTLPPSQQNEGRDTQFQTSLLVKFLKDLNANPPSGLRRDLTVLTYGQEDSEKQPERVQEILDKHGYEHLTAESINSMLQLQMQKSSPSVTSPPTKPMPTGQAPFSLTLFGGPYSVTTLDPPTFVLYVDSDAGAILFDNKTQYVPVLELDEAGQYWATWTTTDTSDAPKSEFKVKFITQYDGQADTFTRCFGGYFTKPGENKSIPFNGRLKKPQASPDSEKRFWETTPGKIIEILGPIALALLGRACKTLWKMRESAAANRQSKIEAAKEKIKAERTLAQEHLNTVNQVRKEVLIQDLRRGMAEVLDAYVQERYRGVDAPQRRGEFVPDLRGADSDLATRLDDRQRDIIDAWVRANGRMPDSETMDGLIEQGLMTRQEVDSKQVRFWQLSRDMVAESLSELGRNYQMGRLLREETIESYNTQQELQHLNVQLQQVDIDLANMKIVADLIKQPPKEDPNRVSEIRYQEELAKLQLEWQSSKEAATYKDLMTRTANKVEEKRVLEVRQNELRQSQERMNEERRGNERKGPQENNRGIVENFMRFGV